ncbi:hypothetical protein [Microbispora bryophytorum]|uniref:hypothetical protein n=1 Tax=Microbispora bryophytorum TaxID=1460882 RepID=UPI0033EBE6D2
MKTAKAAKLITVAEFALIPISVVSFTTAVGTVAELIGEKLVPDWEAGSISPLFRFVRADIRLAVIAGALAAATYSLALILEKRRLQAPQPDPVAQIHARIGTVNFAFAEAARLMQELQFELARQQAALQQVVERAEEHRLLLEVQPETAENVRKILLMGKERDLIRQRRRDVLFLLYGAALSIPIGILVNLIS